MVALDVIIRGGIQVIADITVTESLPSRRQRGTEL
jgi:hypothetical protein